ncbi:MAG: hypothetical protein VW625_07850 [Perlucidibaca sp.]
MPSRLTSPLILLLMLALCSGPVIAAPMSGGDCQRIDTGPGPDDMVIQAGSPLRILISSHDRRHFSRTGDIYAYTPATGQMVVMNRTGEPEGFRLRPHGMDLVNRNGRWFLYVIGHDRELHSDKHSLMIYEVVGDNLRFQQQLLSPLLSSPNDVAVADNGDIYVTNERKDGTTIIEWVLLQRKANVVVYRPGSGWRIAADELAIANGIYIRDRTVWITQTVGEGMVRYTRRSDGTLGQGTQFTSLSLLDGLSMTPDGQFLATAYPTMLGLAMHWQHKPSHARSMVYEVDPQSQASRVIFQDDGSHANAISSAQVVGDRLYLGQLFDPFILSCPWPPVTD